MATRGMRQAEKRGGFITPEVLHANFEAEKNTSTTTQISEIDVSVITMFAFGSLKHLSHLTIRILPEESMEQKCKRLRKQHAKIAPVPIPQKRPRALTLPLLADVRVGIMRKKQISNEQTQSHLFRLPLELRRLIYQEVFCVGNPDCTIHILPIQKKFKHKCGEGQRWAEHWGIRNYSENCANHEGKENGFLALLRACRIIYTEAVSLLYSKPTFVFQDPEHIVLFASTILPTRLDSIRTMELAWERQATRASASTPPQMALVDEKDAWCEALKVMQDMKNLKQIRLSLNVQRIDAVLESVRFFVQQIKCISGAKIHLNLPPEGFWQFDDMLDESFGFDMPEEETLLEMQRQYPIGTN